MHDKLAKILGKKRDLHPSEKHAKMSVVKHLRDMASQEMGSKLDGLKKVSVLSDSQSGLEHGLDKAKQVVSNPEMGQMLDHAEDPYGDEESAMAEHAGDHENQEAQYSEGGMAGYAEGGEVGEEETPDKGDYDTQDQESPADEESEDDDSDEDDEFHGLNMDEVNEKLQKLMKLRDSMGSK